MTGGEEGGFAGLGHTQASGLRFLDYAALRSK